MRIRFTKMTGAGNDFVVIDNRSRTIKKGSKTARFLCDRRWGIGADGLLLLEESRKASYRMRYYNADGSYGGMCGNGGRCIAWFAVHNGIAPKNHSFEALDHSYAAEVRESDVVLSMKDPRNLKLGVEIDVKSARLVVSSIDTGSPHVVIPIESLSRPVQSLDEVDVPGLGREIRYHDEFAPAGTNVNFVERKGHNSIRIRTYERGVEEETLACGTGSIASAIVASKIWNLQSPITVVPRSKKSLRVEFDEADGKISDVRLVGPAAVVYGGVIEV